MSFQGLPANHMLPSAHPPAPITQAELVHYEDACAEFYARCAQSELRTELETVLTRITRVRRELHHALTERKVDVAEQALHQLLCLEAQAAALRRGYEEVVVPPPAAQGGPQDRRKERRRTARE